jgi:hypothetical protein
MKVTIIAVGLILMSGCSGQRVAALERQLRELEDQNFALRRAQVEDETPSVTTPTAPAPATPRPAPVASEDPEEVASVATPVTSVEESTVAPDAPPPAHRPIPVVVSAPTTTAPVFYPSAGGRAMGCDESGPFTLTLVNQTGYFLRVHVAPTPGRPSVRPGENLGNMLQVPPNGRYTTCLTALGEHQVRGIVYTPVGAEMRRVNSFNITRTFSTRSMSATGRQMLRIDEAVINFH